MTEQETQLQVLLQQLIERVRPEMVVLFGSHADGTATPGSDMRRDRRQEAISRALRPRRVPVDILAYTPAEVQQCLESPHSFVRHILTTGKVLYDRHSGRLAG
jgi:hypothetical protein